jgi:hypothetical protein
MNLVPIQPINLNIGSKYYIKSDNEAFNTRFKDKIYIITDIKKILNHLNKLYYMVYLKNINNASEKHMLGVQEYYDEHDIHYFKFYLAEDPTNNPNIEGGRRKYTRHRKQGRKQVTRRIKRNKTLKGRRRHLM